MMRPVLFMFFISTLLLYPFELLGSTIYIPDDHPTIQAGIVAATTGDVIFVAPGTYVENIDFLDKTLTLQSEAGESVTVIDGGQDGSVVTFKRGQTKEAILEGFTIKNGSGTYDAELDRYNGGGIFLSNSSSPTITDCTITANSAISDGGGIYCENRSSPSISNCSITENSAFGQYGKGGGIFCKFSSPVISDCLIAGNTSVEGGGVHCTEEASPLITNCTISDNAAEWGDYADQLGGGISCYWYSAPRITNCTITKNWASFGGGVFSGTYSSPVITNCLISENDADYWGGGIGCRDSWIKFPVISNCLIIGNSATWNGGAIGCHTSSPEILNCTISGNSAATEGGALHIRGYSSPTLTNCILWGDSAIQGPEIWLSSPDQPSAITIAYSDVQGGVAAAHVETDCLLVWLDGSIDADPLFVGGEDYGLTAGSPCIDAGHPDSIYDDECSPPSMGAVRSDMGAYGGLGGCGWSCWDQDGDGYHDPACGGMDCDDLNRLTYPGAEEFCDGEDNDCDDLIPTDETDADGDGYFLCDDDCNDSDPITHPFAVEQCDFKDNDCDGQIDEGPCLLIEALALLGLAGCLIDGETPPPAQVEGGGESGGCGCALYRSQVKSGLAASFLVYLVPVGFILIYKRRVRREKRNSVCPAR